MKDQVNPNVLVYEPSPGKMTELFQTGQAVIAVWGTGRVQAFADTGFPVDFVYPKEGAMMLLGCGLPDRQGRRLGAGARVRGGDGRARCPDRARQGIGYGPVNKKVEVDWRTLRDGADRRARGQADLPADWDAINAKREDWTKRWNREVER